jgi:hypothetical protein
MSLFKSAIQTLSEMAINESGLTLPETADRTLLEDVAQMLTNMPALNEQEMRFTPDMVIVRQSDRLGRLLIEMEDLSRYMLTNGVVNVKTAISNILEANDVADRFYDVAIVVDEASILDEMEDLGHNTDGSVANPEPGLGKPIFGNDQKDFAKIRRVANTKQLLDLITGRYGLPLVKKNYKQEGFLEAAKQASEEDVELKKGADQDVIHEEEPEKKDKKCKDCEDKDDDKDEKKSKKSKEKDDDDDEEEDEDEAVEESANLDPYQAGIQRIKDIIAGKYDYM